MKIVAIGGGEIGRPGYRIETEKIDREIIRLTDKKQPQALLLPTASGDSPLYWKTFQKYYGRKLGCRTDVLYLTGGKISSQKIKEKIFSADIIYVGGGNTLKMMNVWRKYGVDKILIEAGKRGIVLSGLSAGAICWFKYGNSDSRKFRNKKAGLIRVRGLGLVSALLCPHYNVEKGRARSLKAMMKKTPGVGLALDNRAAIEIIDDKYRIITSQKEAGAYKAFWGNGRYYVEKFPANKTFMPLDKLHSGSF